MTDGPRPDGAPSMPMGLDQVFLELQRSLGGGGPESARSVPVPDNTDVQGGFDRDGIAGRVSASGRLEELRIEPSLLRSGVVKLGDIVLAAVQSAQDDVRQQVLARLGAVAPAEPAGLAEAAGVADLGMARFERMLGEFEHLSRRFSDGRR